MGKKINFDEKSKFKRFLSGKGFYVALAVCLVAVCGVAVGTFINSLPQLSSDSSNPASVVSVTPTTKEKPVDKPVTNIPDDRTTTSQATTTGKTTAVNVGPTPAELFVLPTVEHVVFQQREIAATVQRLFDGVLHLFDVRRLFGAVFFERGHHFAAQPAGFFAVRRTGGPHGLEDRLFDFLRTERGDLARPFYDLP